MTTAEWIALMVAGISLFGTVFVAILNISIFRKQEYIKNHLNMGLLEYQIKFPKRHEKELQLVPTIEKMVEELWYDFKQNRFDESNNRYLYLDIPFFLSCKRLYLPSSLVDALEELSLLNFQGRVLERQLNNADINTIVKQDLEKSVNETATKMEAAFDNVNKELRHILGYLDNVSKTKKSRNRKK
ncbi:MAG: hypothetical protein ABFD64_09755 [Armatimonadota bacterium]